jgi:hypothetical protein
MLKAFLGLPTTVKEGLINIPSDFHWYTTMMKVGILVVKESQGYKSHSIKQKFVKLKRSIAISVKKSLHFY